jgi:hypothetical protein
MRLNKCILTRDKKERQGLKSEVLEIGSQLKYHLGDLIRDIKAKDTHGQESPLEYIG